MRKKGKNKRYRERYSSTCDVKKQCQRKNHIKAESTFQKILSRIEEKEQSELAHIISQANHKIDNNIRDQKDKTIVDIESKIDNEINCFETQIKDCQTETLANLRDKLESRKNDWSQVRKNMHIQRSDSTDKFVTLLNIKLAERVDGVHFKCDMECVTDVMQVAYQAIFGKYACKILDDAFRTNSDKKAIGPNTRKFEKLRIDANRISWVQKLKQKQEEDKRTGSRSLCSPAVNRCDARSASGQRQEKTQLIRTVEASKQMLYDVFGNVIRMLEEFEQRELWKLKIHDYDNMPKSDINIPDQGHEASDNIRHIVECRLTIFEIQLKACPREVLSELNEKLKRQTLDWSHVREKMGITEIHQTDKYITQLYEILSKEEWENTKQIVIPGNQVPENIDDVKPKTIPCDDTTRRFTNSSLSALIPEGTKKDSNDQTKMKTNSTEKRETKVDKTSVLKKKPTYDGLSDYNGDDQAQQQLQLQRPMEASKQMLYGVFGNVIKILEEYEQRELAQHGIHYHMLKSDIYIPDQKHKTFADIKSIVECQLFLFETQTKACPPEALAEVREELRRRTLCWSAMREEMGIKEIHRTDRYITKLYEILAKGSTFHRPPDVSVITEDVMRSGVQAIMHGDHDRANIDREFKTNPGKKASGPITRSSEMIRGGANRIFCACGNKDLLRYLEADVSKFENDGPENIK